MFTAYGRRRQPARAGPGDGSPLPPFRFWHLLTRSAWATAVLGVAGAPAATDRAPRLRTTGMAD